MSKEEERGMRTSSWGDSEKEVLGEKMHCYGMVV